MFMIHRVYRGRNDRGHDSCASSFPTRVTRRDGSARPGLLLSTLAALGIALPAAANTSPTADAVATLTTPQAAVAITLNATDPDDDALAYRIVSLPSSGTVSVGGTTLASGDLPYTIPEDGTTATYTPASTTHGAITFTYKANDGTVDSAAATVTVNVNNAPVATTATAIIPLNKAAKITLAGADADSDTLAYIVLSVPGHGVLALGKATISADDLPFALDSGKKEITYTPDAGYHGPDAFRFNVADTWEESAAATQTIEVNTRPTVTSFTVYVPPNGTKDITMRGSDADRDPIFYVILSLPAHGTLTEDGQELGTGQLPYTLADRSSTVRYTPAADYAGTDSFHYEVTDAIESSTLGVVGVAINSPPLGTGAAAVADSSAKATVILAPADADGDTLEITLLSLPSHGQISVGGGNVTDTTKTYAVPAEGLSVTYQAGTDYAGTDAFTWQVSDAKDTAGPYQVTLTIPTAVPSTPPKSETTPPPTTPPSEDDSTETSSETDSDSTTDLSNVDFDPCGAVGTVEAATLSLTVMAGVLGTGIRRRRNAAS